MAPNLHQSDDKADKLLLTPTAVEAENLLLKNSLEREQIRASYLADRFSYKKICHEDKVINLYTDAVLITTDQMERGFWRVFDDLPDISMDVPLAYIILDRFSYYFLFVSMTEKKNINNNNTLKQKLEHITYIKFWFELRNKIFCTFLPLRLLLLKETISPALEKILSDGILENKKTDSIVWKDKDQAWEKITRLFNSQTTEYPRTKESLRKFYDNKRDNREIFKTGGGVRERNNDDTTRDLLLDIVNTKSIFGLNTPFGGDAEEAINIEFDGNAGKAINNENAEVIGHSSITEEHSYGLKEPSKKSRINDNNKNTQCIMDNDRENMRGLSQELRHTWTSRRRPKLQQLHSSKLAEEYSELAKIKLDVFKTEKENLIKRECREEELFKLQKRKLELDIQLKEIELSTKRPSIENLV
ncbi:unnamed protein product [Callosobruchus maculatus]|uniref:Regulatory protein zeste n=1 Tax=Callosobruchus maculatus TaxID=64391 RepID=A0A653CTX7_CALMS|nr:unnamed protein product [Callosobruchus maculatus]